MSSIRLEHVSFRYSRRDEPVLKDLCFTAPAASVTAVLGPSGCGKSTLLRIIAGLEKNHTGQVIIGDEVVASPHRFVEPEHRGVGMVFQDYALFPHMTVLKNVLFGLRSMTGREARQRAQAVLERVELSELGHRYPHELSGGQQQRVAIARALAPAPKVLLLDEPFSNLDADLKAKVRHDVKKLLQAFGVTSVFVSHDAADADFMADQVFQLSSATDR